MNLYQYTKYTETIKCDYLKNFTASTQKKTVNAGRLRGLPEFLSKGQATSNGEETEGFKIKNPCGEAGTLKNLKGVSERINSVFRRHRRRHGC